MTRVRPATPDDFEAVTRLLEELGRPKVGEAERDAALATYTRDLDDPDAAHLVAEDEDGRVLGFCSLHFRPRLNVMQPEAWVPDLIVAEDTRSRGVGRALLGQAEKRAKERGCHRLLLESAHWRKDAHRFYRDLGLSDDALAFGKRLV